MFSKLRPADWLTALGTALLFGATFKPWFEMPGLADLRRIAPDAEAIGGAFEGGQLNVWDLSVTRWFVYAAVIFNAWMLIAAVFGETPHWAIVFNTPALFFSFLASFGLVLRLIHPPADASALTFYGFAVAGGLIMLSGSAWALRDESTPEGFLHSPPPEHIKLDS
ncbi:MAG: hypothetical protein HY827_09550 [Actinobacteria bacterium]|nr:hypothetical protein [Actinomycetota bacterium]